MMKTKMMKTNMNEVVELESVVKNVASLSDSERDVVIPRKNAPSESSTRAAKTKRSRPVNEYRRQTHEILCNLHTHAEEFLALHPLRLFVLAVVAGSFITFGGLLSIALTTGDISSGPQKLLLGFGFSSGFVLVILSGTALYTEVNVNFPVYFLAREQRERENVYRVMLSWLLILFGNVVGALLTSSMIVGAHQLDADMLARLHALTKYKMDQYWSGNGVNGWFSIVLSAALGNWIVGMAAFNSGSARTVMGKIQGIFFPIIIFVATGLQHMPANMGYFFMELVEGSGSHSLGIILAWNLIPAAIGNLIGGVFLVAIPFHFVFQSIQNPRNRERISLEREPYLTGIQNSRAIFE